MTEDNMNLNAGGVKDDAGKSPYDLLAPEFLDEVSQVLAFGAAKYAPRNWEKGMRWGRMFAALMRHMWAWWRGEENDPETGLSHLAHAACMLMFLHGNYRRGIGEDDRPGVPKATVSLGPRYGMVSPARPQDFEGSASEVSEYHPDYGEGRQ